MVEIQKYRPERVSDLSSQPGSQNSLYKEYRYQTKRFTNGDVTGVQKWIELRDWFENSDGRDLFICAFKTNTGIKINTSTDSNARIAAAFPKSLTDYQNKVESDSYYKAMAELFILEMDRIVSISRNVGYGTVDNSDFSQAQRFVKTLLLDSLCLFSDWGQNIPAEPVNFGVVRNWAISELAFYHGALQNIYGHRTPSLSFTDNHAELTGAIIRQGLEIRLRRAFGIVGKISNNDYSLYPIALSKLIETLKNNRSDFHMAVPIENVNRIYRWANLVVHRGMRDYGWTHPRVLCYLKPLLVGDKNERGHPLIRNGIRINSSSLEKIQNELNNEIGSNFEAVFLPPERCTVILEESN